MSANKLLQICYKVVLALLGEGESCLAFEGPSFQYFIAFISLFFIKVATPMYTSSIGKNRRIFKELVYKKTKLCFTLLNLSLYQQVCMLLQHVWSKLLTCIKLYWDMSCRKSQKDILFSAPFL